LDALIATPPFPTYTAGHSAMSGAATTVLARFFGTDNISFTTDAADLPTLPVRSFTSLSGAAYDAGRSRVYAGSHFWFDSEEALKEGQKVAEWTLDNVYTEGHSGRGNETAPDTGDQQGEPASLGQALHDLLAGDADTGSVLGTSAAILAA